MIVGTQGKPFYDGWFVQILINHGNHVFTDATSQFLSPQDAMGGQAGVATGTIWPTWVTVLDFNHDGLPDFSVEYSGGSLTQSTPLIWINDGTGHFHTLKVSDFVAPGNEWQLGDGHLTKTDHGYSFITLQDYSGSGGLVETGLLATMPYDDFSFPSATFPFAGDAMSQIETIYIGYFGRAGDPGGTNYWTNHLLNGGSTVQTLTGIAASYSVQSESQAQYPFLADPLGASTSGDQ